MLGPKVKSWLQYTRDLVYNLGVGHVGSKVIGRAAKFCSHSIVKKVLRRIDFVQGSIIIKI